MVRNFPTEWMDIKTFDSIHEYIRSFFEYDKEKRKERKKREEESI